MGLFHQLIRKRRSYLYTEAEQDAYKSFIDSTFGPIQQIFRETASSGIHTDILVIPPNSQNPYYQLITMGMGAYEMDVPRELSGYELERAELLIDLPPDWNISSDREEDYWPIRYLRVLAHLPREQHTWLGFGHTVSSNAQNTPYAQNTKLSNLLLLNAVNETGDPLDFRFPDGNRINFYQLFPLYTEEMNDKKKNGIEELLAKFDEKDITPVVQITRKNYCQ